MFMIKKSSEKERAAATERRLVRILEENELARQENAEKVAHLRALRMANKADKNKA